MNCMVMGDSIAVGIAWAMPDCRRQVKSAITSTPYLQTFAVKLNADLVVISLGANDWHLGTYDNLRRLRAGITARRVVWLLPNIRRPGVRDAIERVSEEHGDRWIDTTPYAGGGDHVHPTMGGYRTIAARARGMDSALGQ